jgi:DNA-binding response OmpR family regulator
MAIMVADDEEGIRQMLTLFLAHHGYAVVGVSNGAQALDRLQHSTELPDLILLDIMMPVMDGVAFRQAQKQLALASDIPVVVMSAAADLPEQMRMLQAAAALPKPIDFDTLLALVKRYCLHDQQRAS